MNRAEHYRRAEELLTESGLEGPGTLRDFMVAQAHAHATLAACSNEVFNAVLDAQAEAALQKQEQKWAKEGRAQDL